MAFFVRGLALVIAMSVLQEAQSKRVDMASEDFKMIMNASDAELDARLFKISEKTTTGGHLIKLMTLNVEFFTETCDKGANKGIEYCETTQDKQCNNAVTKMLCCNSPQPALNDLRANCRHKGCFEVGSPHSDSEYKDSGIWPSYKKKGWDMKAAAYVRGGKLRNSTLRRSKDPIDAGLGFKLEPRCVQGARNLLQQVVVTHGPDVVATQEDFENYPLQVPGYYTIISADSHEMWYKSPPFGNPQETLKLMDRNKKSVHMVNSLLVKEELLNLEETEKLCKKEGFVYQGIDEHKIIRCGIDLRSDAAAKLKEKLLSGEKVKGWENQGEGTVEKPMPNDADKILLMASRCAALAVVNVAKGANTHFVAASVHLTGGRFDDDLIGLTESYRGYESTQKMEKIQQTRKLMNVLTDTKKPSIIMGDFNGPDDFDIQWWKVLTAPWPTTHPFLGSLFGGKAGNTEVLGQIVPWLREQETSEPTQNHLEFLHTDKEDGFWAQPKVKQAILQTQTKEALELSSPAAVALVERAFEELKRFEQVYKTWMIGMHEELKNDGWKPLATSLDFTKPFGNAGGTTSKFGGMIDFAYVSPSFLNSGSCEQAARKQVDFSNGLISDTTMVKKCRAEGFVSEYQVDVVHGVLKRSTDHAPVVFQMVHGES